MEHFICIYIFELVKRKVIRSICGIHIYELQNIDITHYMEYKALLHITYVITCVYKLFKDGYFYAVNILPVFERNLT